MRTFAIAAVWFVCLNPWPAAATTWYVDASVGASGDGLSWGAAFKTMNEAMDALAAENVGGISGDDHIFVTNGTYNETVTFTPAHTGTDAAGNTVQAKGADVVVDCVELDGDAGAYGGNARVTNIVVDGLTVLSDSAPAVLIDRAPGAVIQNCVIQGRGYSGKGGVLSQHYSNPMVISNCLIFGASGGGVRVWGGTTMHRIMNCIIVNNYGYGVQLGYGSVDIRNSCIYGNAPGGIAYTDGGAVSRVWTTPDEIGSDTTYTGAYTLSFSNCVARNPGLVRLATWDCSMFYTNSPCVGAATDGGNIGPRRRPIAEIGYTSETFYVDADTGDNTDSGTNWAHAWADMTNAAAHARVGDTVMVATGTYTENIVLTNGGSGASGIRFEAAGDVLVNGTITLGLGASDVTLQGLRVASGSDPAVSVRNTFANRIRQCDIQASSDSGIFATRSVANEFTDCRVHDCGQNGVYSRVPSASYSMGGNTFRRCRFYDNGGYGADVRSEADTFDACSFYGNGNGGVYVQNLNVGPTLYNCAVYSNAAAGLFAESYGRLVAYNCTVCSNAGDGVLLDGNRRIVLYNCILAQHSGFGCKEETGGSGDIYASNCLFHANSAGEFRDEDGSVYNTADAIDLAEPVGSCSNAVVADPRFVAPAENNYRLKDASPCIAAAQVFAWMHGTRDLYGEPRLVNQVPDIGAAEFQPPRGSLVIGR